MRSIWRSYFGAAIASIAFLYGTFIVARTLLRGIDGPGYASLTVLVLFFGGIQLVTLGVIGEYLGRTYLGRTYEEAKRRPVYVVQACVKSAASGVASRGERREQIERFDRIIRIDPEREPAVAEPTTPA
jgi:hypothetical protein